MPRPLPNLGRGRVHISYDRDDGFRIRVWIPDLYRLIVYLYLLYSLLT